MNNSKIFRLCMLLLMGAMLIVGVYIYKAKRANAPSSVEQISASVPLGAYNLKSMRLLSDGALELIIKDTGVRIRGQLRGQVSPDAQDEIIRLLNSALKGRMVVLQSGPTCVVDVFLTLQTNEVNLWDWLVQKKLTYQNPSQK